MARLTMSSKSTVDILFKEHSFEEIESVRDNLANEIEKRTELLKSIVKEKYQDVVETSDAIQSMKTNLAALEQSIEHLDRIITSFHEQIQVKEGRSKHTVQAIQSAQGARKVDVQTLQQNEPALAPVEDAALRQLLAMSTEIWDHFDSGNLKMSVKAYNECMRLLRRIDGDPQRPQRATIVKNLEAKLQRTQQIIKNFLWFKIHSAGTNQIGIIAGSDEEELYNLSLQSSIESLTETLRRDISDISFQAQIRRYQQYSYFDTSTNTIDQEASDLKPPKNDYVQIPREISIELSAFLFDTCRVINTIAGFSLTRSSILDSLRLATVSILGVYTELVAIIDKLTGGSKRRRAMQLYFDLMYIRVLLNSSKDLELIDDLDPKISELMCKFEQMLDTIELYIVSDALHTNVLLLSTSTIRLYGLLVPHLQ